MYDGFFFAITKTFLNLNWTGSKMIWRMLKLSGEIKSAYDFKLNKNFKSDFFTLFLLKMLNARKKSFWSTFIWLKWFFVKKLKNRNYILDWLQPQNRIWIQFIAEIFHSVSFMELFDITLSINWIMTTKSYM